VQQLAKMRCSQARKLLLPEALSITGLTAPGMVNLALKAAKITLLKKTNCYFMYS
jgi:hypothetical protein